MQKPKVFAVAKLRFANNENWKFSYVEKFSIFHSENKKFSHVKKISDFLQ